MGEPHAANSICQVCHAGDSASATSTHRGKIQGGRRTELCLWHHLPGQHWYQQHAAVPAVHNELWDPTTSHLPRPHQTQMHLIHRNECGQWGHVLCMAAFSPSPASHHFPNQQKGLVLAGDGGRDFLAIQFPRGNVSLHIHT